MDATNTNGTGHCEHCKWWHHHQPVADHAEVDTCDQPQNRAIHLVVSADSGCNHFEPDPAHGLAGTGAA